MRERKPRHNAIWAVQLLDALRQREVATGPLLAGAGIGPGDLGSAQPFLPLDRVVTLFDLAAEAAGDDLLPFRLGQDRDPRDAGLIGYVGLSAPRLVEAIRNFARYVRVFGEATELDLGRFETEGRARWLYHLPISQDRQHYTEFAGALFIRSARVLTGADIRPLSVSFAHPRRHGQDAFRDFFGAPVNFDTGENVIRYAAADLDRPIVTADDRLAVILREHCEDVLARRGSQRPGLIEEVERAIVLHLGDAGAQAARVAADLGMSQRTLSRRLAELGTSFSQVSDALKRALAERYLRRSDRPLTEIAFLLGYSDLSAFSAAFRRWTGATPGAVRKAAGG